MTIVEVIAALALLASLLVGALLAKSRYTRQAAVAQRRLDAVIAADRLLADWWASPQTIARRGAGNIPGSPHFSWRTREIASRELADFNVQIVRLEIADRESNSLLASVDVMLNAPIAPGEN